FHDAVYEGTAGADEEASAQLATTRLREFAGQLPSAAAHAPDLSTEVARLVLLTRTHSPPPDDTHGSLLCDADLAILGSSPARYARYVQAVRAEYAHVSEPDWRSGRSAVLGRLLAKDPLYRTRTGAQRWQRQARQNLRTELASLQREADR